MGVDRYLNQPKRNGFSLQSSGFSSNCDLQVGMTATNKTIVCLIEESNGSELDPRDVCEWMEDELTEDCVEKPG
jgi:hypothetical protein